MSKISKLKNLINTKSYKELFKYTIGFRRSIAIVTFLNILTTINNIGIALITKYIIDTAISGSIDETIKYGVYFAIMLLLQLGLGALISYKTIRIVESMRNQLQVQLINQIYIKDWLQLNNYKSGQLLTHIYGDLNNIVISVTTTLPMLVRLVLQLVIAFCVLAYFDPLLAALTILVAPISVLFSLLIGKKMKTEQHKIQAADGLQRSYINESINNILILKTYDYTENNTNRIKELQQNKFNHIKSHNYISIWSKVIVGLGYQLSFFFAASIGAYRLYTSSISFGTFSIFIQLVNQVQGPLQQLSVQLPQLISSMSSVERINALKELDEDVRIKTITNAKPIEIIIDNVSFSYSNENNILNNFSLTINEGDNIAIIGPSGEGKTTLIHLILALFSPTKGNIYIRLEDNTLCQINSSTRKYFSYVPQTNSLFSGTIRENFLLQNSVSESDIKLALKATCIDKFIDELELGIDTHIHEHGIGISQGQAQRLTIARALLHNTPILIFDEATSALDLDTEIKIIQNLNTLYPNKTIIAITHRENILSICNKSVYL